MDISPILLHMSGVAIDESFQDLNPEEERIIEALYNVDFGNYDELHAASRDLQDISGEEVVNCILNHWRPECLLHGVKNIEKVFFTTIKQEVLIAKYFCDNRKWGSDKNDSWWLKKFNILSGLNITADDVVKSINMNYLIDSHGYGPGLSGFLNFVVANHGNPKLFIKRIAHEIERLPNVDIEDIVCFMAPYVGKDDIDLGKLFARIDWDYVKKWGEIRTFRDFFACRAPELVPQIPC